MTHYVNCKEKMPGDGTTSETLLPEIITNQRLTHPFFEINGIVSQSIFFIFQATQCGWLSADLLKNMGSWAQHNM